MNDREIRELVNKLRDVAVEFHATQQLRARISSLVVPAIRKAENEGRKKELLGGSY